MRSNGYYWCKLGNDWIILYWRNDIKLFQNTGITVEETHLKEIDEHQIIRQAESEKYQKFLDIIERFNAYSFDPISYDYDKLTEIEQSFCSREEFDFMNNYLKISK